MPITSYYTREELVHKHSKALVVLSKNARETLEIVRQINPNIFIEGKQYKTTHLFSTKIHYVFSLLIEVSSGEVQIYNFPPATEDPKSSINQYVTEQVLHSYLLGIINGYEFAKK